MSGSEEMERAAAAMGREPVNILVGMWNFFINGVAGAIALAPDVGMIVMWNNATLGGLNVYGLTALLQGDIATQAGNVVEFANLRLAQRLSHSQTVQLRWEIEQWLRAREAAQGWPRTEAAGAAAASQPGGR